MSTDKVSDTEDPGSEPTVSEEETPLKPPKSAEIKPAEKKAEKNKAKGKPKPTEKDPDGTPDPTHDMAKSIETINDLDLPLVTR